MKTSSSPAPPFKILRELLRLFRGQFRGGETAEQRALKRRIDPLITKLKEKGELARLLEGRTEEDQKKISKTLEDRAVVDAEGSKASKEKVSLAEADRRVEGAAQLLAFHRSKARQSWAINEWMMLGAEAALGFGFASFLAHLGITLTVFGPVAEGGVSLGIISLIVIVVIGVGSYSALTARQRRWNAEYKFRWRGWLQVSLLFVALGSLTHWWATSLLRAPIPLEFRLLRTVALGALLMAVFVLYLWAKPSLCSRQRKARADARRMEQRLEDELHPLVQKVEETLTELIRLALSDLEGDDRPGEWDLVVPNYPLPDCWRKLSEQYESAINTEALEELREYLDKLERGSIGIAGERGAGKTSVMHALRKEIEPEDSGSRQFLTIWIQAPTAYKEKEFLFSVLAKLATRVGARLTGNGFWPNTSPEEENRRADRGAHQMAWAFAAGVVALGYLLSPWAGYVGWEGAFPSSELAFQMKQNWYFLVLGLVLGPPLVLLLVRWLKGELEVRTFSERRPAERPLLHASHSLLEELWFEQKVTTSRGVAAGPAGVNLAASSTRERARKPFTLPYLVHRWDEYVKHVVTAPESPFEKVVVFIDEVDKIKKTEGIGRFMRILKTLFKPSRLFFVVSISEDAYAQFQARSVRKEQRNEFDSSFDQTVMIRRMSYGKTEELLNERIRGDRLPHPFMQLIWAISRGNARDSIRLARDVLQNYQGKPLSEVSRELVKRYCVKPLAEHSRTSLQKQQFAQQASKLFEILEEFSRGVATGPAETRRSLGKLNRFTKREEEEVAYGSEESGSSAVKALEQIGADLDYAIMLCETFDDAADTRIFEEIRKEPERDDRNDLRTLILRAQRALEDELPDLAHKFITDFRRKLKKVQKTLSAEEK